MPETEYYKFGDVIIAQDDSGTDFYVLEKGAVEVVKDGVVLNVLMYPGTIFGEVSAILGKPRTSTVKARSATTVTKYEGCDLPSFASEHPEMAAKMLETLASRLQHTTQKLTDLL
ncbi:MAG: Crp/Fnr family transcriptional regulator [Opitutales bacterium]